MTPLFCAAAENSAEAAELLLAAKASFVLKDEVSAAAVLTMLGC